METITTKRYPVNEKIRQVILESGLNASQFAEAIGVQRSTISHILSYRNRPGTEILQKITKWDSKYTYDWLMEGANQTPPKEPQSAYNQEFEGQKRNLRTALDFNKKHAVGRSEDSFNYREPQNMAKNQNDPQSMMALPATKPRSPVQINILYDDGSYEVIPVGRK